MLIMAEVSSEMGAELRASALAQDISVAAEVGRRLERLIKLEAEDSRVGTVVRERSSEEPLYSGAPNPWDMFRNKSNGR